MMGHLVSGEADVCLGGLNALPERYHVVDFTLNIVSDKSEITNPLENVLKFLKSVTGIMRKPNTATLHLLIFLKIFKVETAIVLLNLVLVFAVLITILSK